MIGKDEYVWVFNKKMKNWWGPSFGEPLNMSEFENVYLWFILFILGWCIFYKFGLLKWKYTKTDITMCFVGLFVGLGILSIFYWIDFKVSYILVDKNTKEVVLGQTVATEKYHQLVITEDKLNLFDNADTHSHAVNRGDLQKLEKEGKIKTMPLQKWLGKNYHEHDHKPGNNAGMSLHKIKETIDQHLVFVSSLLLTLIFIIRLWNKKVFDKFFPWIMITLIIEILLGTIWYIYQTYRDVVNNFYFIKKGQIVNSCFVITLLFLLIGSK
jgi:hypothetical protein